MMKMSTHVESDDKKDTSKQMLLRNQVYEEAVAPDTELGVEINSAGDYNNVINRKNEYEVEYIKETTKNRQKMTT